MVTTHSPSDRDPARGLDPETMNAVDVELVRLLTRAEAAGLVPAATGASDAPERVAATLRAVARAGVGRAAIARLQRRGVLADEETRNDLFALNADLAASPLPDQEWPALGSVLGRDLLADLLGVSESSIRRYERGQRPTPDPVAARLHHVALIVADLTGAYNDYGIRRWFRRGRSALGGNSPLIALGEDWDPEDEGPRAVQALAAGLVGAGAT